LEFQTTADDAGRYAWIESVLADEIEDASNELTGLARLVAQQAYVQWQQLDKQMRWCDRQVGQHVRGDERAKRAAKVPGIGELSASALIGHVGCFKQFKSADQFSACLGLVYSQNSSGGKASLGRITKRGDDYLRTLLIQGAKSLVMSAGKRTDATSLWLQQFIKRVGWQKARVAMANKNTRILWAVMTREAGFDAKHVNVKPQAKCAQPKVVAA
jgi:transposase